MLVKKLSLFPLKLNRSFNFLILLCLAHNIFLFYTQISYAGDRCTLRKVSCNLEKIKDNDPDEYNYIVDSFILKEEIERHPELAQTVNYNKDIVYTSYYGGKSFAQHRTASGVCMDPNSHMAAMNSKTGNLDSPSKQLGNIVVVVEPTTQTTILMVFADKGSMRTYITKKQKREFQKDLDDAAQDLKISIPTLKVGPANRGMDIPRGVAKEYGFDNNGIVFFSHVEGGAPSEDDPNDRSLTAKIAHRIACVTAFHDDDRPFQSHINDRYGKTKFKKGTNF